MDIPTKVQELQNCNVEVYGSCQQLSQACAHLKARLQEQAEHIRILGLRARSTSSPTPNVDFSQKRIFDDFSASLSNMQREVREVREFAQQMWNMVQTSLGDIDQLKQVHMALGDELVSKPMIETWEERIAALEHKSREQDIFNAQVQNSVRGLNNSFQILSQSLQ